MSEQKKRGVKQKNTLTKEEQYALGEQKYDEVINDPRVKPIISDGQGTSYFVRAQNDIIRYICQMINAQTSYLYIILLSHRNRETNVCIPSLELLAKECNLNVRSVSRGIKSLEDIGAIKVNSGKQNVCNNYYFPFEDFFQDFADTFEQKNAYKRKTAEFKKKNEKNKEECIEQDFEDDDNDYPL